LEETRKENPLKRYAMHLAHQMDDEKRIREDFLPPWKEEEIRECGRYLRDEIFKKGYASQITTILHYAEEYKTLSFTDYKDWLYR
jgi:hypothetical protein